MYELVISLQNGKRYSVAVRDYNEASAELNRFLRQTNDRILDVSVLDNMGNRVSRFYNGRLEMFN